MKSFISVCSCDDFLVCYTDKHNRNTIVGLSDLNNIFKFDVDCSKKIIIMKYNSVKDIAKIIKEYEHNN